jgi:hypothetical protein
VAASSWNYPVTRILFCLFFLTTEVCFSIASIALIHMETPCIIYGDEDSDHQRLSISFSSSIDSEDDNEIEISCTCRHYDYKI